MGQSNSRPLQERLSFTKSEQEMIRAISTSKDIMIYRIRMMDIGYSLCMVGMGDRANSSE